MKTPTERNEREANRQYQQTHIEKKGRDEYYKSQILWKIKNKGYVPKLSTMLKYGIDLSLCGAYKDLAFK
jgi:hypothetical protein